MAGIAAAHHSRIVEVWPECWPAFSLFCDLQTQWRYGPGGMTGLDYNVLYKDLDRMDLTPDQFSEWKWEIQVMEAAALAVVHRKEE